MRISNIMKSRKTRFFSGSILILLTLYSLAGFLVLPSYARKTAVERLSAELGRGVAIESVRFNPFFLDATISGFEIKEADGRTTFLSFRRLYVNLQAISLIKGGPVIAEVRLDGPYVHIERADANTYNVSALLERFQSKPDTKSPEKPGKAIVFSVSNIRVVDGSVVFDDRPASKKHEIKSINLSIPFISNLPSYVESFVEPSFEAVINGTPVSIRGSSKVFSDSRETSLEVILRDIDIPTYVSYAPVRLGVQVESGKVDVAMRVAYRQFAKRSPMLTMTGETRIKDLRISDPKAHEDILHVPLFGIQDISFDFEGRKIEVREIATRKGRITISRSAQGRMVFESAPVSSDAPRQTAAASTEAPWTVTLKSLSVDEYEVRVDDRGPVEPFRVTLDRIDCKAQNISTGENEKGAVSVSLRVDRKGTAAVQGDVSLNPPTADLALRVTKVRLKMLQPYLAGRARILIADGALSLNSALTARRTESGEMNAVVRGKLGLDNISLLDSVHADDLLRWDSLLIDGIEARYPEQTLHIRKITLANSRSHIVVNEDRTLNLLQAFSAGTPTAEAGPQAEGPTPAKAAPTTTGTAQRRTVKIDTVAIEGGTVTVIDNSIKPRFNGALNDITGRISGLSSDANTFGEVELTAAYDRYAPLQITGRVNPLRNDLYVALKADFKGMDLTAVSPYSGRYAGYAIQKGKLSFQLEYLIEKNKLDARNTVFIDQFNFGEAVESPDATRLPVRLAVALLKDRKGEIHLDIPVSGELTDPKFSVGRIVLQVIVNLLEKAATSPFALLGTLFGGEELSFAEFDYSSAALTDDAKKKLDILEKALYERPELKLDITGYADTEKDPELLKQQRVQQKIRAQKIRELAKKGDEAVDPESVTVSPQEYPLFLERAYKEEKFPKPRNALGFAKELPVPEMENLMLANTKVSVEDMKELADRRAQAVKGFLLQSKRIEPDRVFLVEAPNLEAPKKEGAKASRVEFQLK